MILLLASYWAAPLAAEVDAGGAKSSGDDLSARQLRERGVRYYAANDYAKAIHTFELALRKADAKGRPYLEELLARARSAVGLELFNSGEVKQAESMFRLALQAASDAYAHVGIGYLHFVRFENELARQELQRAVSADSKNAFGHKLLALLDYGAGDLKAALTKITRSLGLNPDDAEAQALRSRWKREAEYAPLLRTRELKRFNVRSHQELPESTVRYVLSLLRRSQEELSDSLGHWSRHRVTVVLYPSDVFHRVTGSQHWVGGTYDGQIKLPVPREPELPTILRQQIERAVRHELTHAAIRELAPTCPTWLNEGIAQHFEHQGELSGVVERELGRNAGAPLSFGELPLRLWDVEDDAIVRQTYLQSLSFVDFLCERFHQFRIRVLLDELREEGSVKSSFKMTYGETLERLQVIWWQHVERIGCEPTKTTDDAPQQQ